MLLPCNISLSHRGRKCTPETIEKMRRAHLEQKQNPEQIARLRTMHIGKKQSPEHIAKRVASARATREAKKRDNQPPLF
jgi:hypothetical protein